MKQKNYKMMMSTLFLGALFVCLSAVASSSYAIGLKEQSVINDDTIKLGDIFYDLPRNKDRVLGHAPQPGEEIVLNARTLFRIAKALDLPWRPNDVMTRVTLRREATVVGYDKIKEAIHTALYDSHVYGEYEISIPSQYQKIILPADAPASVDITRIDVDAQRRNFDVTLAAPSAIDPIRQIQIKGKIFPVIKVPVLTRNVEYGRMIKASDIDIISIREKDFSKDMVTDAQKLVGMTARRVIVASRPIKNSDLVAPQIIKRGQLLTLSLKKGFMDITTQVKALENGAKGDVIRVVNTSSHRTLQAIILNGKEAQVATY